MGKKDKPFHSKQLKPVSPLSSNQGLIMGLRALQSQQMESGPLATELALNESSTFKITLSSFYQSQPIPIENMVPDPIGQRPGDVQAHVERVKDSMRSGILMPKLTSMLGFVDWNGREVGMMSPAENDRQWQFTAEHEPDKHPVVKILAGQYRLQAINEIRFEPIPDYMVRQSTPIAWSIFLYPGKPNIKERTLFSVWDNTKELAHEASDLLDIARSLITYLPILADYNTPIDKLWTQLGLRDVSKKIHVDRARKTFVRLIQIFFVASPQIKQDLGCDPLLNYEWYYNLKRTYGVEGTLLSYGNLYNYYLFRPEKKSVDILKAHIELRMKGTINALGMRIAPDLFKDPELAENKPLLEIERASERLMLENINLDAQTRQQAENEYHKSRRTYSNANRGPVFRPPPVTAAAPLVAAAAPTAATTGTGTSAQQTETAAASTAVSSESSRSLLLPDGSVNQSVSFNQSALATYVNPNLPPPREDYGDYFIGPLNSGVGAQTGATLLSMAATMTSPISGLPMFKTTRPAPLTLEDSSFDFDDLGDIPLPDTPQSLAGSGTVDTTITTQPSSKVALVSPNTIKDIENELSGGDNLDIDELLADADVTSSVVPFDTITPDTTSQTVLTPGEAQPVLTQTVTQSVSKELSVVVSEPTVATAAVLPTTSTTTPTPISPSGSRDPIGTPETEDLMINRDVDSRFADDFCQLEHIYASLNTIDPRDTIAFDMATGDRFFYNMREFDRMGIWDYENETRIAKERAEIEAAAEKRRGYVLDPKLIPDEALLMTLSNEEIKTRPGVSERDYYALIRIRDGLHMAKKLRDYEQSITDKRAAEWKAASDEIKLANEIKFIMESVAYNPDSESEDEHNSAELHTSSLTNEQKSKVKVMMKLKRAELKTAFLEKQKKAAAEAQKVKEAEEQRAKKQADEKAKAARVEKERKEKLEADEKARLDNLLKHRFDTKAVSPLKGWPKLKSVIAKPSWVSRLNVTGYTLINISDVARGPSFTQIELMVEYVDRLTEYDPNAPVRERHLEVRGAEDEQAECFVDFNEKLGSVCRLIKSKMARDQKYVFYPYYSLMPVGYHPKNNADRFTEEPTLPKYTLTEENEYTAIVGADTLYLWVWPRSNLIAKAILSGQDISNEIPCTPVLITVEKGEGIILDVDMIYMPYQTNRDKIRLTSTTHVRGTPKCMEIMIHKIRNCLVPPSSWAGDEASSSSSNSPSETVRSEDNESEAELVSSSTSEEEEEPPKKKSRTMRTGVPKDKGKPSGSQLQSSPSKPKNTRSRKSGKVVVEDAEE